MEGGGGAWTPSEGKKKWSIGKLFRRKKKDSESEASSASSDENSQKNNAKRKKTEKKKRSSVSRSNFDSIEHNEKRSQSVTKFPKKEYFDEGVLSDPSAGFVGYVGRGLPRSPLDQSRHRSKDSLYKLGAGSSCGSQDGSLKKSRKGRIKARVEAIRNSSKNDSSSDEESQRSTSSSVFKFRSDDSLANHSKEGSVSKRSRSARNDRYNKRLSRDDESQLNREADLIQKGYSRSEAELLALKQRILSTPQINGYNDEPDYSEPMKLVQPAPYDAGKTLNGNHQTGYTNLAGSQATEVINRRHHPALSASNSSVYSYPAGVINFNAQVNDESITYSVPYNVNKHNKTDIPPSNPSFRRSTSVERNNYDSENVMVVKLPLGSVPKKESSVPPPPPPRDPQRKVSTPVSYMYDNSRPLSYAFESGGRRYSQNNESIGAVLKNGQNIYENSVPVDKSTGLSWGKRPISTSEDHIAIQQQYYNGSIPHQNVQPRRPSSVNAEVIRPEVYSRYLSRPQIKNHGNTTRDPARRHTQENANPEFLYFADKTPRSRRPIHITPSFSSHDKEATPVNEPKPQTKNASDFWKKMDSQEIQRRRLFGHNRALSDQSIVGPNPPKHLPLNVRNSANSKVVLRSNVANGNAVKANNSSHENYLKNNGFLPSKNGITDKLRVENKENQAICYSNIDIIPMDDVRLKKQSGKYSEENHLNSRRKSSNLEDALTELEAIYNSLGLGDEDLLDRAERQEMLAPKTAESLPYSSKDNYFKFPSCSDYSNNEMNRRGSLSTKLSDIPDKVHDDMAYRRMNPNERPKSKDVSKMTSQVSYMLASPTFADAALKNMIDDENSEPDVVLDDVVFRNIRQANNYLKIEDPQPPFGIPIGPISPAPNSDYLHAVPDAKRRSRFIPQESPDIVADDLAYRSLRKDSKNPSPVNKENQTCIFNNTSENSNLSRPSKVFDNHVSKKKRAVRSVSANIFTLIQREIDDALDIYKNQSLEKAQSIPDLPEAVLEFGKSGKLPNNFKSSQQLYELNYEPKFLVNNPSEAKPSEMSKFNMSMMNGNEPKSLPDNIAKSSNSYFNSNSSKLSDSDRFRDELDTMAQEAKETSAKLEIALEKLEKDKQSKMSTRKIEKKENLPVAEKEMERKDNITNSSSALQKYLSKEINKDLKLFETKVNLGKQLSQSAPSVTVKGTIPVHIKEKMEEFTRTKKSESFDDPYDTGYLNKTAPVVKSLEEKPKHSFTGTGKHTEDSLLAISNQLKIVGCKLKNNAEKPNMFDEESMKLKYLANKCEIDLNDNRLPSSLKQTDEKIVNRSNAKYEFLNSDGVSFPKPTYTSPRIVSCQTKIESINNMQSFDELRKGISELLDGIGQVSEKFQIPKPTSQPQQRLSENESSEVKPTHSKGSSIDESSQEETKPRENRDSPEYNSSEELAMIFKMEEESKQPSTSKIESRKSEVLNDSHLELNSPRLVKTANQNLRKLSLEELDPKEPNSTIKSQLEVSVEESTSGEVPWRRNRRQSSTDNANKGTCAGTDLAPSKLLSWYHDPHSLMLACYYSLVCTQELCGLDVITSLGIMMAIVVIIAMLML